LRVSASDLDDLFRTAAEGLFDYMVVNRGEVRAAASESVTLTAATTGDLLAAWLNELIFRCETEHRLYAQFHVHVAADGLSVDAEIRGEPIDRDRHILDHEVKAVTHHGLKITMDQQTWTAELILDI
jgi:SHS2 domain-containing protein